MPGGAINQMIRWYVSLSLLLPCFVYSCAFFNVRIYNTPRIHTRTRIRIRTHSNGVFVGLLVRAQQPPQKCFINFTLTSRSRGTDGSSIFFLAVNPFYDLTSWHLRKYMKHDASLRLPFQEAFGHSAFSLRFFVTHVSYTGMIFYD